MRKGLIFVSLLLSAQIVCAQQSMEYSQPDKLFYEGKAYFDQGHYKAAYERLSEYEQGLATKDRSPRYIEADYYITCCMYELKAPQAGKKMSDFCAENPQSTLVNRVRFLSATNLYNKGSFREAVEEFEKCDMNFLSDGESADYLFKKGYALLQCQEIEKSKSTFTRLLGSQTKYNVAANYYKAYTDYLTKDYEKALPVFEELKSDPTYARIVPYYIFQIYYAQKRYDEVLTTGEELLQKDPKNTNSKEIHRILGECYYAKKDYANTIKYLSQYQKEADQVVRDNMYMLGNSYYQTGDYKNAITCLQTVTTVEDAMGQNAYLYLGSCYTKEKNTTNARFCFESASRMDFDANVKEEAFFNYALTIYEQSYSPFNESITAFERFLETFPNSQYRDKVYNYMTNLYLTTKNYAEAYASIEKIKEKNIQLYEARQRIAYSMGIEEFTNGNYAKAIERFNLSLKDGQYNRTLEASTIFWRGEAYYKQKDFTKSAADFQTFVNSSGARNCDEFILAHYNVGYSKFTEKQYSEALTWFRKYVNMEEKNKTLIADANNRIGDCYFFQRDFGNAVKSYSQVYSLRGPGADYACFQQGFIQGLQKDYDGKIATLNKLQKTFPQSEYLADAKYEIGRAYIMMNQNDKAIKTFDELNRDYPHSPLSRKGRLQTAMLYDEMNQTDKSVAAYKQIVDYFPTSVEAHTALDNLKRIYFEQDNIQGYADYVATLGGFVKFQRSEQDSLTYLAAENLYEKEQYAKAAKSFNNFIEKFPESEFVNKAHYNLADSYLQIKDTANAKKEFAFVAGLVGSPDRENALVNLSKIQYEQLDYKNAIASMETLDSIAQRPENKLAARLGIMRSHNLLGNLEQTVDAATLLTNHDKLDPAIYREALFTRARTYELLGDSTLALADYKELSGNCMDAYGAESQFIKQEYSFRAGKYDETEKEIFDFIDKNTPHQYWLAKSFILLSDVYMAQGRTFEAKQYLLSVRENYSGNDDIASEIKLRLAKIEQSENEKIVNEK